MIMELIFKTEEHHIYYQKWKDLSHLHKFGHSVVLPKATYSPWLDDKDFLDVYQQVKENTLVDIYRCYELWNIAKQANKIDGDAIEVGVWKGGTGAIIAKAFKNQVNLCDTFMGVVKATDKDNRYVGGEHADTSIEIVQTLFNKLSISNYSILQGIFPDDTAHLLGNKNFSFCHIDVDVYKSAKEIFNWVFSRMLPGGVVVFDDYGFAACEGVTELVNDLSELPNLIMLHNINGHAVFVKIK
jgi:O-methyltransferase